MDIVLVWGGMGYEVVTFPSCSTGVSLREQCLTDAPPNFHARRRGSFLLDYLGKKVHLPPILPHAMGWYGVGGMGYGVGGMAGLHTEALEFQKKFRYFAVSVEDMIIASHWSTM